VISARAITKRFGNLTAVAQVSFEIGPGEIVGFIGPNGAGKTTTMRVLTGFLPASSGTAHVAGHDVFESPMAVRRNVGYLPETPPLYPELTVGDYLRFVAEIREVPHREANQRIGKVLEQVGLSRWENRILGSLSKGYRQRVGLAQAVLHDPKVLILDEPTSGLDPGQVVGIREYIRGLAADRTVILSTHILTEVERLCARAIVISGGSIAADKTIEGYREMVGAGTRYHIELQAKDGVDVPIPTQVGGLREVQQVIPRGEREGFTVIEVVADADPRPAIARFAAEKGWALRSMERHQPRLEEAFLSLVGSEQ